MRCYCCDALLSDFEATRRSANTGEFLDMCNDCYFTVRNDVDVVERTDLRHNEDISEDEDDESAI